VDVQSGESEEEEVTGEGIGESVMDQARAKIRDKDPDSAEELTLLPRLIADEELGTGLDNYANIRFMQIHNHSKLNYSAPLQLSLDLCASSVAAPPSVALGNLIV